MKLLAGKPTLIRNVFYQKSKLFKCISQIINNLEFVNLCFCDNQKTNFKMKLRSLSALLLILDKNNLGNLELQNRILRNIHIGKRADMYIKFSLLLFFIMIVPVQLRISKHELLRELTELRQIQEHVVMCRVFIVVVISAYGILSKC